MVVHRVLGGSQFRPGQQLRLRRHGIRERALRPARFVRRRPGALRVLHQQAGRGVHVAFVNGDAHDAVVGLGCAARRDARLWPRLPQQRRKLRVLPRQRRRLVRPPPRVHAASAGPAQEPENVAQQDCRDRQMPVLSTFQASEASPDSAQSPGDGVAHDEEASEAASAASFTEARLFLSAGCVQVSRAKAYTHVNSGQNS